MNKAVVVTITLGRHAFYVGWGSKRVEDAPL